MQNIREHIIDGNLLSKVTALQAWRYRVIPVKSGDGSLHLLCDDDLDVKNSKAQLEFLFGINIHFTEINATDLHFLLTKYYPQGANVDSKDGKVLREIANEDFLPKIIKEAQHLGSSDIHIEAYEHSCRVRFRIDGKLVERYQLERKEYPALINKIKIKANLDIAEKRLPQDGRILFKTPEEEFDIRVSTVPVMGGEKVVLRLLSKNIADIGIEQLGFDGKQFKFFREAISSTYGIILISGPTGSGKTTTLYATLRLLNKETVNILTIEDPIEYTIDGINQVQVKDNIDLTYARALRGFLRQDPDIIMLGEIRDAETAQMAVRAALTGHLVFSTIHTNSAWGTISRLVDMGIPPYLITATLRLSVAQRLVRILCPHCKKEAKVSSLQGMNVSLPSDVTTIAQPVGCPQCFYTGYRGRRAVYEVIPVTSEISQLINEPESTMDTVFKKYQIVLLRDAALNLLRKKETGLDEVFTYL
ncbi:MAG: GspE/PulE family protein [Prevotellaceae bacterium]|jgi:general secretion pathway protein E/type IV pilus assembly protein PilB|nr:GspE/PulE family protein [Prevotellaceae bacterium]